MFDTQLAQDSLHVRAGGVVADVETLGDGIIGQPLGHQAGDLSLAVRQSLARVGCGDRAVLPASIAVTPATRRSVEAVPLITEASSDA